jgi:predicted 2-oxoglutarate/Fe(II)-dependent dioxygenase YbiX
VQVNTYHDCIYEVEDFLSREELQILLDAVSNAPDSEWYNDDYPDHWNGKTFTPRDFNKQTESAVLSSIQDKITATTVNSTDTVPIAGIHRFRVGDTLAAHRDNVDQDFANIYGVVVYLNDEFEGGEIDYPELGFRLKPKANSLLLHHAGLLHQVLEVTKGVRYTLTTFIAGDATTKFIGTP